MGEHTSTVEKQELLYSDTPLNGDPTKRLLPPSFYHLRLAHTLAERRITARISPWLASLRKGLIFRRYKSLNDEFNFKQNHPYLAGVRDTVDSISDSFTRYKFDIPTYHMSLHGYKGGKVFSINHNRDLQDWRNHKLETSVEGRIFGFVLHDNHQLIEDRERQDPAEVMIRDFGLSFIQSATDYRNQEFKLLQMIVGCKPDQVVRALSFFTNSMDKLKGDRSRFLFNLFVHRLGALQQQLEEHPAISKTIGQFFKKSLEYFDQLGEFETATFLCESGIRVLRQVEGVVPHAQEHFPDFRAYIRNKLDEDRFSLSERTGQLLKLVLVDSYRDKELSDQLLYDMGRLAFGLNAIRKELQEKTLFRSAELIIWQWMPELLRRMDKDPEFRNEVIRILHHSKTKGSWEGVFPNYSYNGNNINLTSLPAAEVEQKNQLLKNLIEKTGRYIDQNDQITCKQGGLYVVEKKKVTASFSLNGELRVFLEHQGKRYRLTEKENISLPEGICCDDTTYWIEEENQSSPKKLLRSRRNEIIDSIELFSDGNGGSVIDPNRRIIDGIAYHEIDLYKTTHGLSLLSWFNSLKRVKAYCLPEVPERLSRLEFPDFNLHFSIKNDKAMAINSFPGFYLAEKQKIPELHGFAQYLLLENDEGERRVLLRHQGIKAKLGSYLLNNCCKGMNSPLLERLASEQDESQEFSCYALNSQGGLKGQDPKAAAYLIAHYYSHADRKKLLHALDELEAMGRIRPFDDAELRLIDELMLPLFLSLDHEATVITLRLAAIIEENKLLQRKEKYQHNFSLLSAMNGELLYWVLLQAKYYSYLKGRGDELSEFQELFVGKAIKNLNGKFFKERKKALPEMICRGLEAVGIPNLVESIGMFPVVAARVNLLEIKYADTVKMTDRMAYHTTDSFAKEISTLTAGRQDGSIAALVARRATQLFASQLQRANQDTAQVLFDRLFCRTESTYQALPVKLDEIDFPRLEENFSLYLRLAAGMVPEELQEKSREFKKTLMLLQGTYDQTNSLIIELLSAVSISSQKAMQSRIENLEKLLQLDAKLERLILPLRKARKAERNEVKNSKTDLALKIAEKKYRDCRNQRRDFLKKLKVSSTKEYFYHLICKARRAKQFKAVFNKKNITILRESGKSFLRNYIVRYNTMLSLISLIPYAGQILRAFKWLKGICDCEKEIKKERQNHATLKARREKEAFPVLQAQEEKIEAFFQNILLNYFEIEELAPPDEQALELDYESDEDSVEKAFEKLNQNIRDFNTRKREKERLYTLKAGSTQEELVEELAELKGVVAKRLTEDRAHILEFVNQDREKHYSFNELLIAFVRGENFKDIEERLLLYMVTASRFNVVFDAWDEKKSIEEMAAGLNRKRPYTFNKETEKRLLVGKLAFEYFARTLLWKKPMQQLERMLNSDKAHCVMELIMGSGKTYFGIPMTDFIEADGENLVINIWPAPTAKTNTSYIQKQVKRIFGQEALAVTISRSINWTKKRLWGLYTAFKRAVEGREHVNMVKESAQALELIGIEEGILTIEEKKKPREGWLGYFGFGKEPRSLNKHKERFGFFRQILRKIRLYGKAVIDEAHVNFERKKELNHPIGKTKHLKSNYTRVMEEVMLHLYRDPDVLKVIKVKGDKWISISEEKYKKEILPILAKKLSCYRVFNKLTESERCELVTYLMGKAKKVPAFVLQNPKRSEIGMIKGMLTILLPLVLKEIVYVDFCPSTKQDEEFAKPSEGNVNPLEESICRSPYEAYVKTCQSFLHSRLKKEQIQRFIKLLRARAEEEAKSFNKDKRKTKVALYFKTQSGGADLFNFKQSDEEKVFHSLNESDRFVLDYVHYFVAKQVEYYEYNLSSNSQNFASMFASFFSDTGSIYNSDTYAEGTDVIDDEGTTGESIEILQSKCSAQEKVQVLQQELPTEVLDEILSSHFAPGSKKTAIIERGAAFQGLASETVAKKMQKYIQENRPDLDGVVFYNQDKELVILERGETIAISLTKSKIPKERRLTYFDQSHTYAADIPQPKRAEAVVTIGEEILLEDLAQAIWRMRGLKKLYQDLLLVMTPKVAEKITPTGKPTVKDIIIFATENQAKKLAEDNYFSDRQKISNVVRRAVLDKILSVKSDDQALRVLEEFIDLFRTKVEDDPWKLFGGIDDEESAREVIEQFKISSYAIIKRSTTFNRGEKEKIWEEMQLIGRDENRPYLDKVHVYRDAKGKIEATKLEDLGKQMQVQQRAANEQEEEDDMQSEEEQRAEQNQTQQQHKKPSSAPKYRQWPKNLNLLNNDWLTEAAYNFPIDTLDAVLKNSEHEAVRKLSGIISPNIYVSPNFAPQTHYITPFGPYQLPIQEVLIIKEGVKRKIVLLHPWDMKYWRQKLAEDRQSETDSSIQLALYDITLGAVVATGKNRMDIIGDYGFKRLKTLLKFLNGDVVYSEEEQKILQHWVRAKQRGDSQLIKKAFLAIHKEHEVKDFAGSDIHHLFVRASGKDPKNQMLEIKC